jgi:hypothetical protein
LNKCFTLEEAIEQIKEWRESKKGARGRIPEHCWRHAIRLSKKHTSKNVANGMGLKLSDLERKIVKFNSPLNHTKKSNSKDKPKTQIKRISKKNDSFIEIPKSLLNTPNFQQGIHNETAISEKCILELDLNNGMKVRIFG